jgi:hypothetical protein
VLEEGHPTGANGPLPAFVDVDQCNAAPDTRKDDSERQADVSASADDGDIVAIHAPDRSSGRQARRGRPVSVADV